MLQGKTEAVEKGPVAVGCLCNLHLQVTPIEKVIGNLLATFLVQSTMVIWLSGFERLVLLRLATKPTSLYARAVSLPSISLQSTISLGMVFMHRDAARLAFSMRLSRSGFCRTSWKQPPLLYQFPSSSWVTLKRVSRKWWEII